MEQCATWLEHPRELPVESGPIHVRRLAEGAGRRVVDDRGELAVLEPFNELLQVPRALGFAVECVRKEGSMSK